MGAHPTTWILVSFLCVSMASALFLGGGGGGCGCRPMCPPPMPIPVCPPPPMPIPCPPTFCPPPPMPLPCPAPIPCPMPLTIPCPAPLPPPPPPPCGCGGGGGGGGYAQFLPPPPQPSFTPAVNDCCCQCGSPCRFRSRAKTHGARIFSALTAEIAEDPTCNNEKLRMVIEENITKDPSISKRAIQAAAEERLFTKINVICAKSDFSYVAYTDTYCQATSGEVTCYAFRPLAEAASESSTRRDQREE